MKTFQKALLVALVAIFSFGYASADFRFGVKAGANFNNVDVMKIINREEAGQLVENLVKDKSNQAGWMAGVMAEFTIPIVNIGADVSILYARMNVDKNAAYENKDFIDVPLNLKWKIGLPIVGKFVSPMIYTGPDFLFKASKDIVKDVKAKQCEIGWNLGIGLELMKHVQIQGGYCFGLSNIADYTGKFGLNIPNDVNYKSKKNYWTITAAYLF